MKEQVKCILANALNLSRVEDNISTENCVAWDSLKHLNIVMELEMAFDVEFEPEEIAQIKSLDTIIELINTKK